MRATNSEPTKPPRPPPNSEMLKPELLTPSRSRISLIRGTQFENTIPLTKKIKPTERVDRRTDVTRQDYSSSKANPSLSSPAGSSMMPCLVRIFSMALMGTFNFLKRVPSVPMLSTLSVSFWKTSFTSSTAFT